MVMCWRQVAGVTGKVQVDGGDDEGISTEAQGAAILAAFGSVRRNEVLAISTKVRLHTVHVSSGASCAAQSAGHTNECKPAQ